MFLLLVRIRIASIVNMAKVQLRRSPGIAFGMSALAIAMFGAILAGFLFLFQASTAMAPLPDTLYQVFYFLFLFLLAGSTPFVAATLLQSSDYSLLFSAPVPARAVVSAKLVDAAVTNALQFLVLGVPVLVAAGIALRLTALGWLAMPFVISLFILTPALITALGLLALLSMVGPARLRSAVSLLNALMAAVACFTIVLESPRLPIRAGTAAFATAADAGQASGAARAMPSAWFVDAMLGVSDSRRASGAPAAAAAVKIVALTGLLWLACVAVGGRQISAASLAEEGSGGKREAAAGEEATASSPTLAVLRKDWRYLKRDSILLSQLTMPLILYVVPFILMLQQPSRRAYGETAVFSTIIVGIILFMQTSILSLSSVGLESRAFWILLAAPVTVRDVIWGKFLLSALFTAGTGAALTVVAGVLFGASPGAVAAELAIVVVSAAALSGLGVGLAAAFPRFVYENPAHRVSVWALIFGFFASTGYVLATGVVFATAWLVSLRLPPGTGPGTAFAVAVIFYLAVSAIAVWAPIGLGARRLQSYQWEH
ncbi:MAG TPA: hypothetical protein VKT77_20160 [Chthonomonadaceae bacterium]|nr:hypothetical protein [Chthonomonadaceae bacterium]